MSQDTEQSQQSFQSRVALWAIACFGKEIASDRVERSHRFIEEALELVQAQGISREDCAMLLDYVYGRPAGEPRQEVGGVMVTLAALCAAAGMEIHEAGEAELSCVWGKIEKIREKQRNKPKGPLPQKSEQSQQSPREIAEKLHRKIKRLIDADRQHYEPSGLYEIVTWIAAAIKAERESLAAKDREIARWQSLARDVYKALGPRENPSGDIDDDLRNVAQAHSGSLLSIAALQEENAKLKGGALQEAYVNLSSDYSKLEKQRDALAEALRLVWSMFEDGRIVRNIANDGKPDWALKMLNFTRELQTIQAALASVDEQKQQEPTK